MHSNYESFGSVEYDFRAFRLYIGQPTEFPSPLKRSLMIQPGHEHFIDLTHQVFSTSGINNLSPDIRNCYFRTEGDLSYYDEYTYTNCMLECGIKGAEKIVGCIPWYLPRGENSSVCDPWNTKQFRKQLGQAEENSSFCAHCLPDCEFIKTTATTSSARFRLKWNR